MFSFAKHFYIFYKKEMKKLLKWFTLVEILIVIVIIGILIWALVPRMSAAQGRARDVARKNDLNQLQAAIVVSYQDKGKYPCSDEDDLDDDCSGQVASDWMDISVIKPFLEAAWMNNVPSDPMATNVFGWLWDDSAKWEYRYMTIKSHWIDNGWFVLMAKSEVEWSSNWVVCGDDSDNEWQWVITSDTDVKDFKVCTKISRDNGNCSNPIIENGEVDGDDTECTYNDESELRYVLVY